MIPELLSPASNLTTAITAFECGADAVYAGLEKFNARERNINFSIEELSQLTAYARKYKKKVYITFNTLVKDNELEDAATLLDKAASCKPDAFIIQDFGILNYLKTYLPQVPIHASTQMGIHNAQGVNYLNSQGINRIILERQLTIDELKQIKQNTKAELEVFVHGSLCCSLSGTCLWSSWMGGHSGNRGRCKQPCRRRYHSENGNGFFFSANDLYTLDHIATFKKIGIDSLKIEGRMRKSDYVSSTVSAYRMLLDAKLGEENQVIKKARNILSGSMGRKWSGGFTTKESQTNVLEHTRIGVSGMIIGDVVKISETGFDVKVSSTLKIGDTIRVQPLSGDEGPLLSVTKLGYNNRDTKYLKRGQIGTVFCDKEIPSRSRVYKTGTKPKDVDISKLPPASIGFPVDIKIDNKGWQIKIANHLWHYSCDIAKAKSRPVDAAYIVDEFCKNNFNKSFAIAKTVAIDGNLFIQQRDIRKCRQAFFEYLQTANIALPIFDGHKLFNKVDLRYAGKPNKPQLAICTKDNLVLIDNINETLLPHPVFPDDIDDIKKQIKTAINNGIRNFRITSIFYFELLKPYKNKNLIISTSFPLPITNALAIKEILTWGANKIQLWPELEKPVLDLILNKYGKVAEIYQFGLLPLLQTRASTAQSGEIQDGRGTTFNVIHERGRQIVYPEVAFEIPANTQYHIYKDQSKVKSKNIKTSLFNYDREMV